MASLTLWTWVSVDSGGWWWTGRPCVLRFMELQRVGHDWATELNWAEWENIPCKQSYRFNTLEESLKISFNTPNAQKRELRFKVIFKGSLRFKDPYGQRSYYCKLMVKHLEPKMSTSHPWKFFIVKSPWVFQCILHSVLYVFVPNTNIISRQKIILSNISLIKIFLDMNMIILLIGEQVFVLMFFF